MLNYNSPIKENKNYSDLTIKEISGKRRISHDTDTTVTSFVDNAYYF